MAAFVWAGQVSYAGRQAHTALSSSAFLCEISLIFYNFATDIIFYFYKTYFY